MAGISEVSHHLLIETKDPPRPGNRDQADLAPLARFEPDGGAGGNVQTSPARGVTVELQRGVDLVKMKMTAHLHGPVTGVGDGQRLGCQAGIGLEVGGVAFSTQRVLTDLGLQVAIEYITDLSVMDVELRMGVPLLGAWHARHGGKNAQRNHFFYFSFFIITASFYFLHVFFAPIVGFLHRAHEV